jgi:hypothetical protein
LNSGAVALTRQELRHGLYYGTLLKAASSVAKKLKLDSYFSGRKDKRMKAEELVIRYWALHESIGAYEKPLSAFISNYAETNRNPSSGDLLELQADIAVAHEYVVELFGDHAFNFSKNGRSRFNAAVFDAQMLACSKISKLRFQDLRSKKAQIKKAYEVLQKSQEFARSVTLATSDKAALQGRIHKVSSMLKSI